MADGGQPEILVFDAAGTLVRIIRVEWVQEAVTPAEFDRYVAILTDTISSPDRRAATRSAYARMSPPAAKAFFDELVVAGNGDVWVRRHDPFASEHHEWLVFAAAGRAAARVRLPAALRVYERPRRNPRRARFPRGGATRREADRHAPRRARRRRRGARTGAPP